MQSCTILTLTQQNHLLPLLVSAYHCEMIFPFCYRNLVLSNAEFTHYTVGDVQQANFGNVKNVCMIVL